MKCVGWEETAAPIESSTRWNIMVKVKNDQGEVLDICYYVTSALRTFCSKGYVITLSQSLIKIS